MTDGLIFEHFLVAELRYKMSDMTKFKTMGTGIENLKLHFSNNMKPSKASFMSKIRKKMLQLPSKASRKFDIYTVFKIVYLTTSHSLVLMLSNKSLRVSC